MIYKLQMFNEIESVNKITDNSISYIPFDTSNTDYQQFKIDVAGGIPLENLEGNVMTQEEVDAFLKTIP